MPQVMDQAIVFINISGDLFYLLFVCPRYIQKFKLLKVLLNPFLELHKLVDQGTVSWGIRTFF